MLISRRKFLGGSLAAAAAVRLVDARGLMTDPVLDDLIQRVLATAKKAGATYADVRIVRMRNERVFTREDRVESVSYSDEYGLGVRVIAGGAWGFAATPQVTLAEGDRAAKAAVAIAKANAPQLKRPVALAPEPAHVDVWQTPIAKDPFKIPLEAKAELLLGINAEAMKVAGVKFVTSWYTGNAEWKLLATSDGAYIEQEILRLEPGY